MSPEQLPIFIATNLSDALLKTLVFSFSLSVIYTSLTLDRRIYKICSLLYGSYTSLFLPIRDLIFSQSLSGKSIVFAIEITSNREFWWHGQSKRLYNNVCLALFISASVLLRVRDNRRLDLSFFLKKLSRNKAADVGFKRWPVMLSHMIVQTRFGLVICIALMCRKLNLNPQSFIDSITSRVVAVFPIPGIPDM